LTRIPVIYDTDGNQISPQMLAQLYAQNPQDMNTKVETSKKTVTTVINGIEVEMEVGKRMLYA
jgi:hypothetical protein